MGASGSGAGPRRLVGVRRVVDLVVRLLGRVDARRRVAGRVVVLMEARERRRMVVVVRVIILAGIYVYVYTCVCMRAWVSWWFASYALGKRLDF